MHDKLLTVVLLCVLLAGCGGLRRELVYRPRAPIHPGNQITLGRESDSCWHLDLDDHTELVILPVVLSSKLTWVFGPLIAFPVFFLEEEVPEKGMLTIGVFVNLESGSRVTFDTREFKVTFEEGRVLTPINASRGSSSSEGGEAVGPVTLSGEQTWRRFLQYDVLRSELPPFALQLGTLTVNEQTLQLPPIPFEPGKTYGGD